MARRAVLRLGEPAQELQHHTREPRHVSGVLSVAQQSAELDHEHFQHVMASGIARARIPQTLEARLEALHRCPLGDQPQWVESIRPAPGKHKSHLSRLFQRRFPSAQHSLQPRPWATIAGLGADWLDQTSQLAPRHHALHLRQKGGPPCRPRAPLKARRCQRHLPHRPIQLSDPTKLPRVTSPLPLMTFFGGSLSSDVYFRDATLSSCVCKLASRPLIGSFVVKMSTAVRTTVAVYSL